MSRSATATRGPELKAGDFIMIDIPGTKLDAETRAFIVKHGIRAACLFRKNLVDLKQVQQLNSDLREAMGEHALIAVDHEGGAVQRATFMPWAPSGMSLGAAGDVRLAETVGAAAARSVAHMGFNWNFSPVLDINSNPANPVIGERSFGSDPDRAAELALAWMRGSMAQGVACCVKHFPGHGDTSEDSHLHLPSVSKSREALEALELRPFRAAARIAPAMMTAHIMFPALDPELPATLSPLILHEMLRKQWNYDGVVIGDALNMKAIADNYGQAEATVMCLRAGADMAMVLFNERSELERVLEKVTEAIQNHTLEHRSLQMSRQRVDALATRFPAHIAEYPAAQREADEALMRRAWAAGLTAVGPVKLPARGSRVRVVVRGSVPGDGVSEAGIGSERVTEALRDVYDLSVVTFDRPQDLNWDVLPRDGTPTVLVSTGRERYSERESRNWRPDLHIVLWNPYQALDIHAPALLTYGYQLPALESLAAVLRGDAIASGVLPMDLTPVSSSTTAINADHSKEMSANV
jgi:beta-N-acetylhexosaminidase